MVRCLRGRRNYLIRIFALTPDFVCRLGSDCVLVARLGFPSQREKSRAHYAGHRRCNALHDASELTGLTLPVNAGQTRPAVVVSRDANILLLIVDCSGHRAYYRDRAVDRNGMESATSDE